MGGGRLVTHVGGEGGNTEGISHLAFQETTTMAFPDSVVEKAWATAGRRCQCRRKTHRHPYDRCNKLLVWMNRGREGRGCWEAHHLWASGGDTLTNCQILCWDCHSRTF